ncbi:MAG: dihydropteroate synthase [Salinibacterium sp.]|nr:dihydropteroate synthase [Salinibacterium sp.]
MHDLARESIPTVSVAGRVLGAGGPTPVRPLVLGILNVTPDSFSDGGQYESLTAAVDRGIQLQQQGADIVDIGGESTRPGAERVSAVEEQRRVIPVIRELAARQVRVSIDTMNASTARAAVAAGASIINDVSGGLADPQMYSVVADADVYYIAMHWRGHSRTMNELAKYADVVTEVRAELAERLDAMDAAGLKLNRVILDPGLGFAKTAEHNWSLLARLDELAELGRPLLVGASRKRFLGDLIGDLPGELLPAAPAPSRASSPVPATELRDAATAATSVLAASAGAWGVRVHDVASTTLALAVWSAWQNGRSS